MVQITYGLVGICIILMIFVNITDSISKKRRGILFFMALVTMMLIISNHMANLYNGATTVDGGYLVRINRFLAYSSNLLIIYVFTKYLRDLLLNEGGLNPPPKTLEINLGVVEGVLIAGETILIVSQFLGIYYFYDETNTYRRLAGYPLSYVFPFFALVILIGVIVKNRQNLRKRLFAPLLLFTTMPIIASAINFKIHNFVFIATSIVGMTVLLYCFTILDANDVVKTAHEKEIENIKLMVSQTAAALAEAIDAKDSYTNGHSRRVAEYSAMIAKEAGYSKERCDDIYLIALLHDVGKIGVPGDIINKKGRLTDEEYDVIKTHPKVGREILGKITIDPELSIGASYHHERYDGKGYPYGLRGEEIPQIARIIAVADTYDAMTSKRSYRDGLPMEKVRSELEKGMGTQFDPKFAKIMLELTNTL